MSPLVRHALELIDQSFAEITGVEAVAETTGVSLTTLRRAFRRDLGVPPREVLALRRVSEAQRYLRESDLRISEVIEAVGWTRTDSAARAFHRMTGMSMRVYRQSSRTGDGTGPQSN